MSTLLIVDDEESICWGLARLGENIGHEVTTASSAEQALEQLDQVQPDVIVLDVRLPGMDGLSAMEHFRKRVGPIPIIIITAYGDLETAVESVRNGAYEYIVKPFDLKEVQRILTRALTTQLDSKGDHQSSRCAGGLVGQSPAMQDVYRKIALAASSDAGVILWGESGTGKELAARAIHQYSHRASGPFVAINVASLSPSLVESELFGHTRGSFTSADQEREGLLVQANGGTLFLDEVADIPKPTQVKLLRALDLGEVTPVGSCEPVKSEFRVVAATHQDLLAQAKTGSFRHDLYFRLGALRIDIPPLRDRSDDIPLLAKHFLAQSTAENGVVPHMTNEAMSQLRQRPWHGNVRELRNAVEYAVIMARGGAIEPEHLPRPAAASLFELHGHERPLEQRIEELIIEWAENALIADEQADQLHDQFMRMVEPPLLKAAIEKYQGQVATAARRLGLHRTTLRKKLDQRKP